MSRFARQTILPGFGNQGQEKLSEAKVLVVGAGGLGCPILLHLAAAGVGTLGIADGDSISESNLNRQTLFGVADIGKPKAETAASILKDKYPDINFEVIPEFLSNQNILEVLEKYDLVLDGSDNFGTRYLVNDACFLLNKPLIMGAIFKYEGQLGVFNYGGNPVNYRDIYPKPPRKHEIPNCAETGVLGVLPGLIGVLQATEAIKLLSGVGEVLEKTMLFYDLRSTSFFKVEVTSNPSAREEIPITREEFSKKDYAINCGAVETISWQKAMEWANGFENSLVIDVRALREEPQVELYGVVRIPKSELEQQPEKVKAAEHVFLFCKSGVRSAQAAGFLKNIYPEKRIFSIVGGILDPSSPLNSAYHESKA